APAAFPVGTTWVTWSVTDSGGNSNTCAQSVTVLDTEAPSLTCPATVTANTDPNSCSATGVVLGEPVTSDNCGIASITNDAPAAMPVRSNTVTWTVVDVNGNSNN